LLFSRLNSNTPPVKVLIKYPMKLPKLILTIILGVITVNILSWLVLGLQVRILARELGKLGSNRNSLENIQTWTKWYPWVSLGLYRLPYIYDSYQLVVAGTQFGLDSVDLGSRGVALGSQLLTGEATELSHWQSVIDETTQLIESGSEHLVPHLQNTRILWLPKILNQDAAVSQLTQVLTHFDVLNKKAMDIKAHLPILLGFTKPQHYLVVTQNNMELWPTGGYMGSYVEFWLDQGALKDFRIEAIDVPNGQIQGYVEAPTPISKYTHSGGRPGWKLRESNWNPDFPEAAKTIDWFFTQGKVAPIDMLIATNLIPVMDVIEALGPVDIADYDLTLTQDNFYIESQKRTSYDFFPGSTQKRDFLGSLGRTLIHTILVEPAQNLPVITRLASKNLNTKQIMIWSKDEAIQAWLTKQAWTGSLYQIPCDSAEKCQPDYLHLNEANLGINKTNCCIERHITQKIKLDRQLSAINHTLDISFTNNNPPVPKPPENWGGGYKVYLRLYLPKNSSLEKIVKLGQAAPAEGIEVGQYKDFTIISFLGLVQGGQAGSYQVSYTVPLSLNDPQNYQLFIQKQSGIDSIPWQIWFEEGKPQDYDISTDSTVQYPVPN
jgi:hypothetical protein